MNRKDELIKHLDLQPHPEGGFYKETYRCKEFIPKTSLPGRFGSDRSFSTSIYFLLTSESFSALHKINQDEIWHFYEGSPIELHTISESGEHQKFVIGSDITDGHVYQLTVPANHWFAAKVIEPDAFALVGCTVAPGFDFDEFELGNRKDLIESFPRHESLIIQFTRF